MPEMKLDDTIAAVATPIGEGGISVIRLSGAQAFHIAREAITLKKTNDWSSLASHTVHFGKIYNEEASLLDQVLVSFFRHPHSYTGEDVIEIGSHGGMIVTQRILDRLIQKGARHAEPGEFTKRAFLNGKMDLMQAEAVLDLIKAKSEKSMEAAVRQLTGTLSEKFCALKDQLMNLYAHMEAYLDFPEEDLEVYQNKEFLEKFGLIEHEMTLLLSSFKRGRLLREGISVVIVGKPNVGKSSLFNTLLERDRALVSEFPGTTRDHLEEALDIQGAYFRLVDTAGLGAASEDPVDRMGMEQTLQRIMNADLCLFVLDASEGLCEADREAFMALRPETPFIVVANKSDLGFHLTARPIEDLTGQNQFILMSSKTREGFETLEQKLADFLFSEKGSQGGEQITRLRHRNALESALRSFQRAKDAFQRRQPMELVTIDIKAAIDQLKELIGEVYSEDLLDVIFAEFCIGK